MRIVNIVFMIISLIAIFSTANASKLKTETETETQRRCNRNRDCGHNYYCYQHWCYYRYN